MKILFSMGEMEKDINANTKIVLQLAEKLVSMGHSCVVAGVCNAFPRDEVKNGVQIKRMAAIPPVVKASEAFEQFAAQHGSRNSSRAEFVKKHPLHSVVMFLRYRTEYSRMVEQPRYLKQLKTLAAEFCPDVLVCVCKPVNYTETVAASDIGCPMYLYQLDPWGLHRIDNPNNSEDIINRELAVLERAKGVFTTPVLKRQYLQHSGYRKYADKIESVEFPNIKKYQSKAKISSAIEFDSQYVNILFCDIVADQFRSPEYVLRALETAFESGEKIRVYFLGVNNSRVLDRYIEKYPQNVFFFDKVPADKAFATMEKADVLLNISNTLDNQVPSKIFDYFSMGKPVLNLQKIENCPAEEYFEKYPICFNMKEFEKADSGMLYEFLKSTKGRKLDFDEVEKIYSKATVEYVAGVMAKVFEDNA